jgi:hypothetical protein
VPGGATPPPGGGPGNNSPYAGLLARSVFADPGGADSIVNTYTYDAGRRINTISYNSTGFTDYVRFERNAAGIITAVIIKNAVVSSFGLDSLTVRFNYNAAQSKYQSAVFNAPIPGVPGVSYTDSTVFTYNAANNLASKISHLGIVGMALTPEARIEYTYAGNNLVTVRSMINDNGNWEEEYALNYGYDDKVNALQIGNEALLLDQFASPGIGFNSAIYFGPHNATRTDYVDVTDPSNDFNVTSNFTYNTANKPAAGTALEMPANFDYVWRFSYY